MVYFLPFHLLSQCSAYSANASSETTWTMRATFPEYVVALATIAGSVLFSVYTFSNDLVLLYVVREIAVSNFTTFCLLLSMTLLHFRYLAVLELHVYHLDLSFPSLGVLRRL